jgi:hypothetical protein
MPYEAKMARMVLDDCRHVLVELRKDPQGPAWRVLWFCALAMLKAVEDVLYKVDAQKMRPYANKAIHDWRQNLKKTNPAIYRQFIREERRLIVHYYKQRAKQSATVRPGVKKYHLRTGHEETVAPGGPTTTTYEIAGQDPRDVVQEAIDWWEEQLTKIETDARHRAEAGSSPP